MAIQILPRDPSVGESFGTGLGQGLSMMLQQLAQQKIRDTQAQAIAPRLKSLLPQLSDEKAYALASLDPQAQQVILKSLISAPQEQAYAQALGNLIGAPSGQQQPYITEQLQQLSAPSQQIQPQTAKDMFGITPAMVAQLQQQVAQPQQMQTTMPQGEQKQFIQESIAPRLNAQQATKLAQLQLKKEDMNRKEVRELFKLSAGERKEILDKARVARQDLRDLERIEDLEREGKLDTPGYIEFLKRSGLDIPALMNEGSEEFQKITQNFMRNAKTYLGARISNFELEQFLKTIPSLSQSPEGRKRVISNLKQVSRAALAHNEAMKEVIKNNNGIPPLDLLEKIDDRIEPKLDAIAKQFKKDISRPVPQAQNKLVTALQSALGSVAGSLGGVAKAGALGAGAKLVGKIFGL